MQKVILKGKAAESLQELRRQYPGIQAQQMLWEIFKAAMASEEMNDQLQRAD